MRCEITGSDASSAIPGPVLMNQGDVVSLDTYFNSFYESFYANYTNLLSTFYALELEGDFSVLVYRSYEDGATELVSVHELTNCETSRAARIPLPCLGRNASEATGRIHIKIESQSTPSLFAGGFIATNQNRSRHVSLGIISCTFRREEYLKKTVQTIVTDEYLKQKHLEIYVVDNGNTLSEADFPDKRVRLIPNRNVGGSGGFSRGLIEALRERTCTHLLLMDDDIELEAEALCRLFALYEYANQDFAVSGTMLDLYKKTTVHEAGALWAFDKRRNCHNPLALTSLKNGTNLENAGRLDLLLQEEPIDFGAFWFFSLPEDMVRKIGLTMPFFVRGDDIEFGLRITRCLRHAIVAFPGIAVWHEPFYAKISPLGSYYYIRNSLILNSVHSISTFAKTISAGTHLLLSALFLFDYYEAETCVRAFQDYLTGPALITQNPAEQLHARLTQKTKSYTSRTTISLQQCTDDQSCQPPTALTFKKLVMLATLNGHLLPNNFIRQGTTDCLDVRYEWEKIFMKRALNFRRYDRMYQTTMNRRTGIRLLFAWAKIVIKAGFKWPFLRTEWREASRFMTSQRFWENYLGLTRT